MRRRLNIHFASPHFETDLPLCAPRCQFSALSFSKLRICCRTGRIIALFMPHYPVNKWQCERANGWEPKSDRIIYPFLVEKQCSVWELSLYNRILIISAGEKKKKHVFPFCPDKTSRFSQLPPLTPNNCGNIKMHEMGEKFKWLQNVGREKKKRRSLLFWRNWR